ncbi:FliM/FliN family flagellar motor switch protein [Buchnera aphidicola]|uniref:Flagellar motor switch protein FliM n=1 Tax=Buchnera aphidicola subsp. Uroleucon sonchi TaxID=118118 RepID=A0A6C1FF64_BUCUN|nr:FliM/FliN family flagellar motor switch protein [Buchnera aphidicola]QIE01835.1 flagellar motor switch protein FliM [Buchnera aphidicola (Uroleucon sonchi)]
MGKTNILNDKFKTVDQKNNNLKNFLQEDEIQILENINQYFIKNFISFFSKLIKNQIQLIEYNFKIESYNFDNIVKKHIECFNIIEISPRQDNALIIFYNHFLSYTLDLLFGGFGKITKTITKSKDITNTNVFINTKIITFITNLLSNIYTKYFCTEINFIYKKLFFDNKTYKIDSKTIFLTNNFNFMINNITLSFDILIPKSIISQINLKKNILLKNHNNVYKKKNKFSLEDIKDVELNIIARMISTTISKDKFDNLSVGDVLPIHQPDKIIGYLENQPIFFGKYKSFNKKYIVFIEKFINHDSELNKKGKIK